MSALSEGAPSKRIDAYSLVARSFPVFLEYLSAPENGRTLAGQ